MKRIKKNERLGLDIKPSDTIGDSVMDRVNFVRSESLKAKKEWMILLNHP